MSKELVIELAHRHRLELKDFGRALIRLDHKCMIDKIEGHVERQRAVGNGRRGQPARGHVEGYLPPMVHHRCARHAHLADNLRPSMQRVAGILPIRPIQTWPRAFKRLRAHGSGLTDWDWY